MSLFKCEARSPKKRYYQIPKIVSEVEKNVKRVNAALEVDLRLENPLEHGRNWIE